MARPRKARTARREPVDVTAVLAQKIIVAKDGRRQTMSPFEVSLRAQTKKALKGGSLPAIRNVIAVALKYDLMKPAPEPPKTSGVVVVPGRFGPAWAALFEKSDKTKT